MQLHVLAVVTGTADCANATQAFEVLPVHE